MGGDINRWNGIGRLTKDPELKYTPSGNSVTSFSIASNYVYYNQAKEKKEQTSFFNCICWGKRGEVITQHFTKGQKIAIEGRLQQRSWETQDGSKRYVVEIVVDNFNFAGNKPNNGNTASPEEPVPPPEEVPDFKDVPYTDDDIPF
jgi:single-strand DNA-binding protein